MYKNNYYRPSTHILGSSLSFLPVNTWTGNSSNLQDSLRPQFLTRFETTICSCEFTCASTILTGLIGPT